MSPINDIDADKRTWQVYTTTARLATDAIGHMTVSLATRTEFYVNDCTEDVGTFAVENALDDTLNTL